MFLIIRHGPERSSCNGLHLLCLKNDKLKPSHMKTGRELKISFVSCGEKNKAFTTNTVLSEKK